MSITLISVSQLLREVAEFVLFTKKFCVIHDLASRTLIGAGKERDVVYHYAGEIKVQAADAGNLHTRELWHRRLRHPSSKVLSVLSSCFGFSNNSTEFEKSCDIFVRAKQTRDVFSQSSNKADGCFSLIHCDLWGPYKIPSSSGARYFLTIVDDFSRAVWTVLLLEKKEAPTVLKNFFTFVERQFNNKIKTVRSDNGGEFISLRSFFETNGAVHQTSCVETPQKNGRVERKHRHILNMARALLFQAQLPIRFWGESVLAATYLINRTPSIILGN
ncbi:Retrovirus-related Pol polyprotein from transposon TNT 1-94 [Cardamine amara subsp. amara]|uniref:Retrovirus-related Pol polyprotein from transposon TNT 1-94 n=1 Tax=Cardamine amara subsp. amara TaxID=228776 RepID=A0ABD1BW82_CARAN